MKVDNELAHSASFRDPSGFVFERDGIFYRKINACALEEFRRFDTSDFRKKLGKRNLFLDYEEISSTKDSVVIKPEQLDFISYPYEWSFSQLKDAALATLSIQRMAVQNGFSLKDASAYNIQFHKGRALLMDTLSFEDYEVGKPWVAYRQFCQHFLAPILLYSQVDHRLTRALLTCNIDGVPLDLCSNLLPKKSKLSPKTMLHIHLHAKSQQKYASTKDEKISEQKQSKKSSSSRVFSKNAMFGLLDSLRSMIDGAKWRAGDTEWGDYYQDTNYENEAAKNKGDMVDDFAKKAKNASKKSAKPLKGWDLGANTGIYSKILAKNGFQTIAFDIDPVAVEKAYLREKMGESTDVILPLLLDLTNPSPAIGWANEERENLLSRAPTDIVMALALIHHLAISNNLPFAKIAEFFAKLGKFLIIEFVPKPDSQVQRLLSAREDIFDKYDIVSFRKEFEKHFSIVEEKNIGDSIRTLFLLKSKSN